MPTGISRNAPINYLYSVRKKPHSQRLIAFTSHSVFTSATLWPNGIFSSTDIRWMLKYLSICVSLLLISHIHTTKPINCMRFRNKLNKFNFTIFRIHFITFASMNTQLIAARRIYSHSFRSRMQRYILNIQLICLLQLIWDNQLFDYNFIWSRFF